MRSSEVELRRTGKAESMNFKTAAGIFDACAGGAGA
jgi:hypothetical protein